jgi:hypothetical protein
MPAVKSCVNRALAELIMTVIEEPAGDRLDSVAPGIAPGREHLKLRQNFRMQAFRVTLRVLLGVFGGYAVCAASSAALALALTDWAGFERAESAVLCAMLGFAFYLFALLWAFTTPRLSRVAVVLLGGSLLAYGVVRWLSPVALSTPVALHALAAFAPLALGMGG